MRRGMDGSWIMHGDKLVGVSLGADFTSEHEWGIEQLRKMFQMDDDKLGIDRRTANAVPEELVFFEDEREAFLMYHWRWTQDKLNEAVKKAGNLTKLLDEGGWELNFYDHSRSEPKDMMGSWDRESFGVRARFKAKRHLKEIYEAFKQKDGMIFLGGGQGLLGNAGLVLAVKSKIPHEAKKKMMDRDLDTLKLAEADEATGIKKVLEKAGKKWYALSPRWVESEETKKRTKHPVIYWLNPMEQDTHESGWFTVEDLTLWAENKGPVIKEKSR